MNTVKTLWSLCNEVTLYHHYNVERVIEKNHVRSCFTNILSEYVFRNDDNRICVLGFIDFMSLMVIDRDVEISIREINFLRVAILQLLCLWKLFEEKTGKEIGVLLL